MGAVILFLAGIASIAAWWLAQQRLGAKPWLEEGVIGHVPQQGDGATARVGLGVFLAVASSLFSLLISAYFMRKDMALTNGGDWQPQPIPTLLWLNTGALVMSSFTLQWAQIAARRGQIDGVRDGLRAGGAFALLFLIGQLAVWRQLVAAGYYAADNPASSFFYLLTGIHGLHVAGGLVALGKTYVRAWRGAAREQIRISVGLCTAYWHFLLLVWLLILAILTGGAEDFGAICRGLVSW
jgi:cytochrome c oxidase subunit 3